MATPAVGCRVRILKEYATVRYIGAVAQQQGTWVGVEWDDPSRGKHDGSTAGIRYFNCASGTNSGSFVRIERVSFGVTLLDALRARYNNEMAERGEEVAAEELYVHTSRRRRVQVQLVGEERIQQMQRQIHMLQSARLVGLDVSAVGDPSQLRDSIPSLTSLDLTCNLVAGWEFVEQLAGQGQGQGALPQLSVLNLSENRLAVPSPASPTRPLVPLPGLRVLVLNDCGLSWQDVVSVASALPSLEELHLCGNPITDLQLAGSPGPPHQDKEQEEKEGSQPHAAVRGVAEDPESNGEPTRGGGGLLERSRGEGGDGEGSGGNAARNVEANPATAAGGQHGVSGEGDGGGGGNGGCDVGDEAAADILALLFPRLQVLTLEDCQLSGWSTLEVLHRLPALSRLHLAGNTRITQISYPGSSNGTEMGGTETAGAGNIAKMATQEGLATATAREPVASPAAGDQACAASDANTATATTTDAATAGAEVPVASSPSPNPVAAFSRLTSLFLGGCGVADWGSVDQLDKFPELREVRLTGNPVLKLSKTGGRFEVIARVSRLTQLNGAEVRPRERRDSELRYLQHIAAEMEQARSDESRRAAVRTAHPRLRRLMELHGAVLATAARGGGGGGSLASSTAELKLTCVATGATAKMGTQVKKLPKSTTVSALRLLCERLFKVKSDQMALFLRAPGDPLPEDIGSEDLQNRTLGFFGVQDGYEVLVDEADPEAMRRADEDARAAATAAHEQRLAEQLRAAEKLQAEFARTMGLQQ